MGMRWGLMKRARRELAVVASAAPAESSDGRQSVLEERAEMARWMACRLRRFLIAFARWRFPCCEDTSPHAGAIYNSGERCHAASSLQRLPLTLHVCCRRLGGYSRCLGYNNLPREEMALRAECCFQGALDTRADVRVMWRRRSFRASDACFHPIGAARSVN